MADDVHQMDSDEREISVVWLRQQRHRVINWLLGAVLMVGPLGILPGALAFFRGEGLSLTTLAYVIAYVLAGVMFAVRRIPDVWRAAAFLLLLYAFSVYAFLAGWLASGARTFLLALIVIAGLLIHPSASFAMAGVSLLTYIVIGIAFHQGWLILRALPDPTTWPPMLVEGVGFVISIAIVTLGAWFFQQAQRAAEQATQRVRVARAALSQRAEELESVNRLLSRRAEALTATSEIAQDVAAVLDEQTLLARVADLVHIRFETTYTAIFLMDAAQEWIELTASSGGDGIDSDENAAEYRQKVGSYLDQGLVGYVAGEGHAYTLKNVEAPYIQMVEELVAASSKQEVALPMRARGQVIGVLDVWCGRDSTLEREDIDILQILADLVGEAISNARLFRKLEESAEAERRAYGELSYEAWRTLLRDQAAMGVLSDERGTLPVDDVWEPQMQVAFRSGDTVQAEDNARALAIPIQIGGRVIGVLDGRKPDDAGGWTEEEIEMLETLTEQLSATVERARLYEDTQRSAARDRTISQVGARIRESLEMDTMLRTAAAEMRQALNLGDLVIRLAPGDQEEE